MIVFLNKEIPIKPEPSNNKVAGSETLASIQTRILMMRVLLNGRIDIDRRLDENDYKQFLCQSQNALAIKV